MKSFIYNKLKNKKLSNNRKPIIMYGARQVGKTYIIKEFGNNEFENIEVKAEENVPLFAVREFVKHKVEKIFIIK